MLLDSNKASGMDGDSFAGITEVNVAVVVDVVVAHDLARADAIRAEVADDEGTEDGVSNVVHRTIVSRESRKSNSFTKTSHILRRPRRGPVRAALPLIKIDDHADNEKQVGCPSHKWNHKHILSRENPRPQHSRYSYPAT